MSRIQGYLYCNVKPKLDHIINILSTCLYGSKEFQHSIDRWNNIVGKDVNCAECDECGKKIYRYNSRIVMERCDHINCHGCIYTYKLCILCGNNVH